MNKILIAAVLLETSFWINAAETVHLWSGREQSLPGTGKWELTAAHGRILASGDGEVRFFIPALADGTALDTVLTGNNMRKTLRFHSPKLLTGIHAGTLELPENRKKSLISLGLTPSWREKPQIWFCGNFPPAAEGRIFLVFPDRRDFPVNIGNVYDEVSMLRAKNRGSLSVFCDRKEQQLDLNGDFFCAVLRRDKKTIVVFSPDFDPDNIESVLLIKQILKEESEK